MKSFFVIILLFLLFGCSTTNTKILEPVDIKRPLPSMSYCDEITKLDDKSFEAIINKLAEVATMYKVCSSYNKEKADWIERGNK